MVGGQVDQAPLVGLAYFEADGVAVAEDPVAVQEDLSGLGEELVGGHAADELALGCHAGDDGAAVDEKGRVEPDVLDRGVELVREGFARGWSRWHNGIVSP